MSTAYRMRRYRISVDDAVTILTELKAVRRDLCERMDRLERKMDMFGVERRLAALESAVFHKQ
jgi:hypothetical protein